MPRTHFQEPDPAPFYGHSEYDLGITRMFSGFPSSFFSAYHSILPKQPGFEQRALLYELHHYLNHLNIFGVGYRDGVMKKLRELGL
jgi:fructosamine-3-kinase